MQYIIPAVQVPLLSSTSEHCLVKHVSVFHLLFKGDSLFHHRGHKFSTRDQDNDMQSRRACAQLYKGGWWYYTCFRSNLNGHYYHTGNATRNDGLVWYDWKRNWLYSLRFSEMKVRPVSV